MIDYNTAGIKKRMVSLLRDYIIKRFGENNLKNRRRAIKTEVEDKEHGEFISDLHHFARDEVIKYLIVGIREDKEIKDKYQKAVKKITDEFDIDERQVVRQNLVNLLRAGKTIHQAKSEIDSEIGPKRRKKLAKLLHGMFIRKYPEIIKSSDSSYLSRRFENGVTVIKSYLEMLRDFD